MSSIHHQGDSVNFSIVRSVRLDFEQIKMLEEAAENPAGFVITKDLEEASKLSRSTTLKYAAELVEQRLFIRKILPGSKNKYRPTYAYTLVPGITKEAIEEAFSSEILKFTQEQKSFEQKEIINQESHQECSGQKIESTQTELLNDDSLSNGINSRMETNGKSDVVTLSSSSQSKTPEQLDTNEVKIVTLDEILEVFEETTKILIDRISEQDERIAQLEEQVFIFKSARTTRDPKEVLRNVRSRFNREPGSTTKGNGKIFNQ